MYILRYMISEGKFVMKKMLPIIFIVLLIVVVFAGCMSFKGELIPEGKTTEENLSVEEYETLVAQAMDVAVTDENGEAVTNEAGEEVTKHVFVAGEDIAITDPSGEKVTNAAGETETTRVYKDPSTGKEIKGEVYTTFVYKDKNGNITAEKPSNAVPATKPSTDPEKPTKKPEKNTEPSSAGQTEPDITTPATNSDNEFEYLRSGNFYLKGTMTDSSGVAAPLEMAITPNSIYMLSNFEGANMGMLVSGKKTYMIYEDKKSYLELSSSVLKYMGMDTEDMISTNELDYSQYELSKADQKIKENVRGTDCDVYIFNSESGTTRFYMNGNKLVRFATYNSNGIADTVNDVEIITGAVPADKSAPPAGYKAYTGVTGMFSFMSLLSDLM